MTQIFYRDLNEAQDSILREDPKNIFIVTGRNSFKNSGAKRKLERLLTIPHTQFYNFSPNPKLEDLKKGIELYKTSNPDYIVAVGGGSTIDMAKLIKGLSNSHDIKSAIINGQKAEIDNVRILAVPTTSGSGSESTPFSVVYIGGTKYSLQSNQILPDGVVLDFKLSLSMSRKLAAITGFDALSQAIESYWSVNSKEESQNYSLKSIELILENLKDSVNNSDQNSRREMMLAANLAGRAIAITKTTAPHALSYKITTEYSVPHGHAVALTLREFIEKNYEVNDDNCNDSRGSDYVKKNLNRLYTALGTNSPLI